MLSAVFAPKMTGSFEFREKRKISPLTIINKPYLKRIKRECVIGAPSKLRQSPCYRTRNARRFENRRKQRQNVRHHEENHGRRQALVFVAITEDFCERDEFGVHVEIVAAPAHSNGNPPRYRFLKQIRITNSRCIF